MMKTLFFILTLLSLRVSAADQVTPASDVHYGFILSKGYHAEDFDVLISRHQDRIYSFKYCRARDAKGQPTKILEIRRKYLLGQLDNKEKVNQLVENLFASQDCESIGFNAYATFDSKEIWSCRDSSLNDYREALGWGIGISGIFSIGGGIGLVDKTLTGLRIHNTESFLHFLTSKKFPRGSGAREVAYLSVLTGLSYLEFKYIPGKQAAQYDLSSLSFCQDDRENLQLVESMSDFKKSFHQGLDQAVKTGAFSGL